jgi:hypothetical protein
VLAVFQIRWTMHIISFGRAALVVAVANGLCIALPLLVLSLLVTDVDFVLVVGLCIVLAPAYVSLLFLGRRPLMLTVLRGLVRRRGSGFDDGADGADGADDTDGIDATDGTADVDELDEAEDEAREAVDEGSRVV